MKKKKKKQSALSKCNVCGFKKVPKAIECPICSAKYNVNSSKNLNNTGNLQTKLITTPSVVPNSTSLSRQGTQSIGMNLITETPAGFTIRTTGETWETVTSMHS